MNLQTRIIVGVAVIAGFIFFTNSGKNETSGLTNDDIQSIIVTTEGAFNDAEESILGNSPVPPDVDPQGPDPDPKKCICKGTGKIVQGDGHVSSCPYHGNKDVTNKCNCGCNKDGCECTDGSCRSTTMESYIPPQRRGIFGGRLFGR